MFLLVVGCGRVGSTLARNALTDGHEVSVLDENADTLVRLELGLGQGWAQAGGTFTVGTGLELDALTAAGIERADMFCAATNGDNTNIVIAQIATERFGVPRVVARVLDPLRAEWYSERGMRTICPTKTAIEMFEAEVRDAAGGSA
ncbi:MAG: potassium channel family protein [Solirubrobacterales bacterium]